MNKPIIHEGGFPFTMDLITFMDDAYRSAIYNMLKGFKTLTSTNFIVSGCTITENAGVSFDISDGMVFLNDELLLVESQTVLLDGKAYAILQKLSTYDNRGNKVFRDGNTRSTRQVNKAVGVATDTLPIFEINLAAPVYINEQVRRMLVNMNDAWRDVGVGENPIFLNGWDHYSGANVGFCKDVLGNVRFKGIADSASATDRHIFTLPEGYRPQQSKLFYTKHTTTGAKPLWIFIATNGEVTMDMDDSMTSYPVPLDVVSFNIY